MSSKPLAGKVCIVTGATRGIGKGIALQLAEQGGKVYITGRTLDPPKGTTVGGSLRDTVQEIEARGGICVPVQCDHSKDQEIESLFEQVKRENEGQLDILVNNAYSAVIAILNSLDLKFWEQPPSMWDDVNNVGLRNHYICSVYAARLMVPRKQGLIVNISSFGGLQYLFNVAYGIGKEACDRMAADCGFELKEYNVAVISLWPGFAGTENALTTLRNRIKEQQVDTDVQNVSLQNDQKLLGYFDKGERTEFSGKCIAKISTDPDLMKMSGKILMTSDLARKYGLKEAVGFEPTELRRINDILRENGHPWLAWFFPSFLRIPKWLFALGGNRFY